MSQPFKLYRLQQIDSKLDATKKRISTIQRQLAEDLELRAAKLQVENCQQEYREANKSLRNTEAEVAQQHLKIEQSESSLYSGKITNPKELQDLQNELASLRRYLVVLEERQLEAMITEEDANRQLDIARARLAQIEVKTGNKREKLSQELEQLQADIARIEEEKLATIKSILRADLDLYQKLRTTRAGIAVAKVSDNACSACGSTLSAALLHAARSPSSLTCCETCGRILYAG